MQLVEMISLLILSLNSCSCYSNTSLISNSNIKRLSSRCCGHYFRLDITKAVGALKTMHKSEIRVIEYPLIKVENI